MADNHYENQKAFFEANNDLSITLRSWGIERSITVEEIYQHFKARLLDELEAEVSHFEYDEDEDAPITHREGRDLNDE